MLACEVAGRLVYNEMMYVIVLKSCVRIII